MDWVVNSISMYVYYIAIVHVCAFQGGLWVIDLMDSHGATFVVLFIAFSELVGIFWIYGKASSILRSLA